MKKSLLLIMLIMIETACAETAETLNRKAARAMDVKNYEEAKRYFRKTVSIDPDNFVAHTSLGWIYKIEDRLDEAIVEYKRALAITPTSDGYNYLGYAYFAKGELTEAVAAFKDAKAMDPDSAIAYYHLGLIYEEQGNSTLAVKHMYEAGVLALLKGNKSLALKAYHTLQNLGAHDLERDLKEMIAPWLSSESKSSESTVRTSDILLP